MIFSLFIDVMAYFFMQFLTYVEISSIAIEGAFFLSKIPTKSHAQ